MAELAEQHAAADQEAISEAPALLRVLYADPEHTAEHLALWSVMRFAGRATSAVEKIQRARVAAEPDVQQRAVVQRQTRVSMTEGAVVGGPFIVLIPVAFCAALLAQAQWFSNSRCWQAMQPMTRRVSPSCWSCNVYIRQNMRRRRR